MTTTKNTMATLKAHCKRLGLELEHGEAGRYEHLNADCPPGKVLEPGLHHFHCDWHIGDRGERQAAIDDICERLAGVVSLDNCDDPNCDYCNEVPANN